MPKKTIKSDYSRKCPECREEITYSTKSNKNRAEKRNTNCLSCSKKGIKRKPFTDEHKKNISISTSGKNNPMYGKKRSEHSKRMRGENHPFYGKKHSGKTRKKMSESHTGIKPKSFTDEARKNMRISALKRIERDKFNGNQMMPGHNPIACGIIDEYSKKHGFNFQHAENGGEICIDGYFPDGLDEKRKTIIEIDEKHHFNFDGTRKEKDIQRQKYLEGLGYKIIRVKI